MRLIHGVLAPHGRLRLLVVPAGPDQDAGVSGSAATEPGCTYGQPVRIGLARRTGLR